jgi:hypothetical protein
MIMKWPEPPRAGQDGHMEVQGFADGRFGLVRACFAEGLLKDQLRIALRPDRPRDQAK